MSNYPDDIRQYDNDPRSPFYVEPLEPCSSCWRVVGASQIKDKKCEDCQKDD